MANQLLDYRIIHSCGLDLGGKEKCSCQTSFASHAVKPQMLCMKRSKIALPKRFVIEFDGCMINALVVHNVIANIEYEPSTA